MPSDGVRAGVPTAEEVEGGGVEFFTRPPVRERKAVKRLVVAEARRSGVRGTCSGGGDMRLVVAVRIVWVARCCSRCWDKGRHGGGAGATRVARAHRVSRGCYTAEERGRGCPSGCAGAQKTAGGAAGAAVNGSAVGGRHDGKRARRAEMWWCK